ncbi:MAG: regulatory protein RecX [Waddliaceae bacterium]
MDLNLKSDPQKKRTDLYIDDEKVWSFPWSVYGKNLTLPKAVTKQELFEKLRENELQAAYIYCLKKLSERAYHTKELEKKLREFGINPAKVIEKVIASGFIDDAAWTDSFIRVQAARKVGPRVIQQKLKQKGITVDLPEVPQREAIEKLLRKRDLLDRKERQKAIAFVLRKGFSWEAVQEVLDYCNETPEDDFIDTQV